MSDIARALEAAGEDADYDALYRAHRDEDGFAPALVDLSRDPGYERVALWMLKRFFESDGRLPADDVTRLLGALDGLRGWEAQLLALQCLPFCPVAAADRVRVEAFLRTHLAGKNKFLRAWAYNGFELLARQFPDYRDEADALLEMGLRDEPPAIKARIRNILKERERAQAN